ncbi:Guanylate cyclase domain-containing protein [Balamuthia mandrillaris]
MEQMLMKNKREEKVKTQERETLHKNIGRGSFDGNKKTPEEMLSPYVPWMVKRCLPHRLMEKKHENERRKKAEGEGPRCFSFPGAVVFVDISGFTPLTEALCRSSAAKGGEIMHLVLKRFFTELLNLVEQYGGDVIKFAGDALLIVWSSQHEEEEEEEEEAAKCNDDSPTSAEGDAYNNGREALEATVRLAARFAVVASKFEWKVNLEAEDSLIKDLAADKAILSVLQNVTLRVKVGVSAGEVVAMQLGGVNERWEYLLAGKPLLEIAATEHDAAVSTVVVTSDVWSMLKSNNEQQKEETEKAAQHEQEEESKDYIAKRFPSGNFLIRSKQQHNGEEHRSLTPKQRVEREAKDKEEKEEEHDDQLLPKRKFRSNAIVGDASMSSLSLRIHKERVRIKRSLSTLKQGANWMQGYVPEPLRKWLEEGYSLHHLADIRQTTVLFIGLSGLDTTTMDCFEPLQNALSSAQEVLLHYKGALRQFIVDDKGAVLIAVFGLPHMTLEDDAVRAINAALVINSRLHELNLANSIGITTGRTFCGNVGSAKRCEYCVVGDSVNLSARLMVASAKASNGGKTSGAIYVDEQTYRIVTESEGRFLLQPLEPILVKGKEQPIPIYTPVEGRRKSLREAVNTSRKMIGRTKELNALRNAFDTFMQDGRSFKVAFIKGQAGMGKTAMVRELLNWNEGGVLHIDGQAPEIEKNTPYFIWQEILSSAFAIPVMNGRCATCHQHFRSFFKRNPEFEKYLALLNPLLVTQFPETEESKKLEAKERRAKLHEILAWTLNEFRRANGDRPIVLVLENCHWLDSASWNVVTQMIDKANAQGVFLVLTARPPQDKTSLTKETKPNEEADVNTLEEVKEEAETLAANIKFLEEAHPEITVTIELDRMSNEQIAELAKTVMNRTELNETEEGILFSKSQGNPMIAISLALTLPKIKLVCIGDTCFVDPSTIRQLPNSIESVITSTVDKLSVNQQTILKVASVIGSRFTAAQLQNILAKAGKDDLGQEQFLKELQTLRQMSILSVALDRDDLLYFFENPFAQKTIYGMLPFSERYKYHAIIADWYERRFSADSGPHFPLLAYHWRRAQVYWKAIRYYDLAGEFAFNNYAGREAASSWLQAIKLHERVLQILESSRKDKEEKIKEKVEEDERRNGTETYVMEKDPNLRLGRWYRMIGLAKGQVGNLLESVNYTKKAIQILGMPMPESDEAMDHEIHQLLKKVLLYHMYPSRFVGRFKDNPHTKELLEAYKRLLVSGFLLSWDNKIFTVITLQLSCLAEQCDILMERALAYSFVLINVNRFYNNWGKFAGYHWNWLRQLFQRKSNSLVQHITTSLLEEKENDKESEGEAQHQIMRSRKEKLLVKSMLEMRMQFLFAGIPGNPLVDTIERLEQMAKDLAEVGEHLESDSTKTFLLNFLYLQGELERGIRVADELLEDVKLRKHQTHEEAAIRMKTMLLIRLGDWQSVERYNTEMVEKKLHTISPSIHFAYLLRVAYWHLANGQMDAVRENFDRALSLWEDTFLQQIRIMVPIQLAFEESTALWEYEIAQKEKEGAEDKLEDCMRKCEFVLDVFWKMSAIFKLGRCAAWYAQGMFFALSGMIEKAHLCWNQTRKLYKSAPNFLPVERALELTKISKTPINRNIRSGQPQLCTRDLDGAEQPLVHGDEEHLCLAVVLYGRSIPGDAALATEDHDALGEFKCTGSMYEFIFAPCAEVKSAKCNAGSAQTACQKDTAMGIGALDQGKALKERAEAGTGFWIQFTGGYDRRASVIEFVCDKAMGKDKARFECLNPVEQPQFTYNFRFTSRFACPVSGPIAGGDNDGLAGGWIFLISLSGVVVVYLVGGVAYQKFGKRESGLHLVPNLEFWKALPGYVKDGCVFCFDKAKAGVARLRGQSYDAV